MRKSKKTVVFLIVFAFLFSLFSFSACKPKEKPLNVIIMWHNHQPFYKNPVSQEYILPWVRLHGAKDYYRMPYIVSQYPDVKVSFDLSGTLIEQITDYINGANDERGIISEKLIDELSQQDKWKILQIPGGFFDINWDHILKKIPMYDDILAKRQDAFKQFEELPESIRIEKITSSLSNQDYTNLIALFNLFWMDSEYVKSSETLKLFYDKAFTGVTYTSSDIAIIMNEQKEVIKNIFPEYKKLLDRKQIELVTTPYAHPISALLTDFGWTHDLSLQIDKANKVFREAFDADCKGVWTPECAINDKSLELFSKAGWEWTISDADNLFQLGVDVEKDPLAKFRPYEVEGVTIFFRDKYLSDGIGFRYSGKSAEEAVDDFETALLNVQKENKSGDLVYTIALDGENAWEYYENDGNDFLNGLYKRLSKLQEDGKIRTVTPTEYIEKFGNGEEVVKHTVGVLNLRDEDISLFKRYSELPSEEILDAFGESSWVNPTLDTWIGEKQENIAWMWLKDARDALMVTSAISEEEKNNALENLLRAEGSDWFWWYGSDQDSGNDQSFDRLFKMYLYKIYQIINVTPPDYLFGNYLPDGTPYRSILVNLEKDKYVPVPTEQEDVSIKLLYEGDGIKAEIYQNNPLVVMGIFSGGSVETPFFLAGERPEDFNMSPFPYDASNAGIPLDSIVYVSYKKSITNPSVLYIGEDQLKDKNNIFIAFMGGELGNIESADSGTFVLKSPSLYTLPIHVKIPLEIKGEIVGELLDDEGDDCGPGTFVYPHADVFKQAGKRLFDITSFKMIDSNDNYILQYGVSNLGGNPWNGPNGISLQILETYIDFKDGGKVEAIDPKGPVVVFSDEHPWDIALRIAGWSYGNFIELADGTVVQGELSIQVDQQKNLITVSLPKKYIQISEGYKPYIAVISGSQDGYAPGYFRRVEATASEWQGGGADVDAVNAGISPNVYDIFVPLNENQKEILSGFDVERGMPAVIPFLPLEKIKPVPKLTSVITTSAQHIVEPGDEIAVHILLKNIGKGIQKDDPMADEFVFNIPEDVILINESISAEGGDIGVENGVLRWNGSIDPERAVGIDFVLKLSSDIANGRAVPLAGYIFEDSDGDGENDQKIVVEGKLVTNYFVSLIINLGEDTFTRNGEELPIDLLKQLKAEYITEWEDVGAPLAQIVSAIGGIYQFDPEKNKITIEFMGNKFEHWIGQNKSLLNGSAIPLYPGSPDVKSFFLQDTPILPLKSIVYAFRLDYTVDKFVAQLQYEP